MCDYLKNGSLCLLRSIYQRGHANHVGESFCQQSCGQDDLHKLAMLCLCYNVVLVSLPTKEEAEQLVAKKRQAYLLWYEQNHIVDLPPLRRQVKDLRGVLLKVTGRILKGQRAWVSKRKRQRRLLACEACDLYLKSSKRCGLCGCYLRVKSWLVDGHCSLGKWD